MKHPLSILALLIPVLSFGAAGSEPCKGSGGGRTITVAPSGGDFRTIQPALNKAQAGDTVLVKAGTYSGGISFPRSGKAGACISLKGEPGAKIRGGNRGLSISSKDYISVSGLTITEIQGGDTPTGIAVRGTASHIELRGNKVSRVRNGANAHGISFHGTSSRPMSDLLITENEIFDCKLGQSETLVLNGNVEGFVISRNRIHDNDNIGIDIIGYEGTAPKKVDFARNGVISGNIVSNITTRKNATYKFKPSAGGIYVDGGRGIRIEGNQVSNSDIGIELASEHENQSTSGIIVRNNQLSGSYMGNLMMGGYEEDKGKATNITIENNSFSGAREAEIILQHNNNGIAIKGNQFRPKTGVRNIIATGGNNRNLLIQGNFYSGKKPKSKSDLASRDGSFTQLRDIAQSRQPGR